MRQLVTKSSAVEKAARLARDGSLDAALKQYGDLFTLYPSDWSVANALGDLYVRLGRTDDAVAHFVKLAEQLEADGYTAKARAVFRKVLRMQPGNSHAQARVAELETRHLETGAVVNRAIAAARTQFLSQGDEREDGAATDVDDRPPATPLLLTPFAATGSAATRPLTAGEDGSSTPPPAAVAPPPSAYAQRLEPLAERWPGSPENALPADTQGPGEISQGPPTFEDLLDRLDPDRAEPATSFEQALDSLDPVAPAAAARPLEDALDEMDFLETVPGGLAAAGLETPVPAVHEPVGWSADPPEPHAFDGESVDGGELQVAEADGSADMAAEQFFMPDEAAADLDPYQAFDPDVAATAAGDDAEYDPEVIEQGSIETLAADPDTVEQPGPLSEDDGSEWDANNIEEDTDQGAEEPVAPSEDDADNNELAELLRALEEQTRTEGQTLSAVTPDGGPLDGSVDEFPGEDLELLPADASAEREPFDSDADTELELSESSEPVDTELAEPDGHGDFADLEVEGEAVAGGDGFEPAPIAIQIAGAVAEQDPGSVAIEVDVGSIDYDPGTAVADVAAGETQTGLESPGEATPPPAEEPFTAVELQVEDEIASGRPLIELVVPAHAASEEDFEEIRITVLDGAAEAIRAGLARAEDLIAAGELAQAMALLQDAMCALPLRHAAGARLARVYRETGDFASAMECLEWVAEREPADEAAGHELAYELAVTLEAMGQRDHALGIYRELLSEVGAGFRDVAARARQLAAA